MPIRKPHVAGSFYPSDPVALQQFCSAHLNSSEPPIHARAVILPHAGYVYSGITACQVLSRVTIPQTHFLIGPNHRGFGSSFALFARGEWETPLGRTPINERLAQAVLKDSSYLKEDEDAHAFEHSLEVILPLLQTKNPAAEIVPLIVGTSDLDEAREVALAVAKVLITFSEPVLIVISTDMSHYEEDSATRKKDKYALDAILQLDHEALIKVVRQHGITMCGFIPVYMLLVMAEGLGIKRATLVDYRTSANATGERDRVVGYAGFILE